MTTRRLLLLLALIFALGFGLAVSHLWQRPEHDTEPVPERYIWLSRRLDLMIQAALMFAGALGIRAMLPHEEGEGGEQ